MTQNPTSVPTKSTGDTLTAAELNDVKDMIDAYWDNAPEPSSAFPYTLPFELA